MTRGSDEKCEAEGALMERPGGGPLRFELPGDCFPGVVGGCEPWSASFPVGLP